MEEPFWITAQRAASIVEKARIFVKAAADDASERPGAKAKCRRLEKIADMLDALHAELFDMRP